EPVQLGAVAQVLPAAEAVVEGRLGRDDPAAATHLLAVDVGVEPEGPHLAGVGGQGAGDGPDGGGLPGAVGPEEHGDAALGDHQVQAGQRRVAGEGAVHAAQRHRGGGGGGVGGRRGAVVGRVG